MVRETLKDPADAKTWLGFWDMLVPPSPKFHCHREGLPTEVSVNCTAWLAVGESGL